MNYFTYIFTDSFGEFDEMERELLDKASQNQKTDKKQFPDSDTLEVQIAWAMDNGDFEKARTILESAKKYFPNSEEFMLLEILLEREENLENALELCNKYCSRTGDDNILLLKATLLFLLYDFIQADECFYLFLKKVLNKNDEAERADFFLNMALFLVCEDFSDENGDLSAEIDVTRDIHVKKYVEEAIKLKYSVINLNFFADRFFTFGYVDIAKKVINHAIDIDSYNVELWRTLAVICSSAGEYAEAAEAYKYLIALNDYDKHLYFKCAVCYQKIGKYKESIENFELQIEKYPDELLDNNFWASLLIGIGLNYMQMEDFVHAITCFNYILNKINSNHFQAFVYLGRCYYLLNDNDKAIFYVQKAIGLKPDYDNFEYENLYSIIGQLFLDFAQQVKPFNREYLINAVVAYSKSLMYLNMARRYDILKIEMLDAANSATLTQLGSIYFLLSDYINALINFQMAYRFDDRTPQLNIFLTLSYLYLGMKENAFIHYKLIDEEEIKKNEYHKNFPILDSLIEYEEFSFEKPENSEI
ncbi:MAG: tetratricopeptide repeat protein [Prevotellaceae bacterium]|jgi:tetratricopeptide (TPR) repeat protein|nr:tetratricopeptide repeat protein [Prevotellaceae bacterium]